MGADQKLHDITNQMRHILFQLQDFVQLRYKLTLLSYNIYPLVLLTTFRKCNPKCNSSHQWLFVLILLCCLDLITSKGNIHNNPILSFRGLPVDDKDDFIYGIEDEIEKTVRSFKLGSKQQEHNLIDALKISCRKFSKEKTGKKPFTNINLVKI